MSGHYALVNAGVKKWCAKESQLKDLKASFAKFDEDGELSLDKLSEVMKASGSDMTRSEGNKKARTFLSVMKYPLMIKIHFA
jgi:Ca2+-binding EF-hand superfamily protein